MIWPSAICSVVAEDFHSCRITSISDLKLVRIQLLSVCPQSTAVVLCRFGLIPFSDYLYISYSFHRGPLKSNGDTSTKNTKPRPATKQPVASNKSPIVFSLSFHLANYLRSIFQRQRGENGALVVQGFQDNNLGKPSDPLFSI